MSQDSHRLLMKVDEQDLEKIDDELADKKEILSKKKREDNGEDSDKRKRRKRPRH